MKIQPPVTASFLSVLLLASLVTLSVPKSTAGQELDRQTLDQWSQP